MFFGAIDVTTHFAWPIAFISYSILCILLGSFARRRMAVITSIVAAIVAISMSPAGIAIAFALLTAPLSFALVVPPFRMAIVDGKHVMFGTFGPVFYLIALSRQSLIFFFAGMATVLAVGRLGSILARRTIIALSLIPTLIAISVVVWEL